MSVRKRHATDPDRLADLEPGTILREHDTGTRILIVWAGRALVEGRPGTTAVIYADADTTLTIESRPEPVGRKAVLAPRADRITAVTSLKPGAIFNETDDLARTHRFIRTFTGVVLDNGLHLDTAYDGGYAGTALQLVALPQLTGERV